MSYNPTVLLVVGPPRSGTSAISGALSAAGVDFGNPDHFLDPNICQHNPIFFELAELNALNDEIFALFGKLFTESFRITEELLNSDAVRDIESRMTKFLQSEFNGESPLIGLKDPRFCYTGPVWLRVLKQLNWTPKLVYVRRNAEECRRSNYKVNPRLSARRLDTLWIECTLAAKHLLRDASMHEVNYNTIMAGDPESLTILLKELKLPSDAQEAAVGFFNLSHRHIKDVPKAENGYIQYIEAAGEDALKTEYPRYLEISALHSAPEQLDGGDAADEPVHAQLYYARDGFFTEGRSEFAAVLPRQKKSLSFLFDASQGPLQLRLDPMRNQGVVEISQLRLMSGQAEVLGARDLVRLQAAGSALLSSREGAVQLLCWGNTPQLIFPEVQLETAGPLTLELTMFCDTATETVQRVQGDISSICKASMAELESMENSLSWRITAPLRRLHEKLMARSGAAQAQQFDYQQWIQLNEPTKDELKKLPKPAALWEQVEFDPCKADELIEAVNASSKDFCLLVEPGVQLADHAAFMFEKELQHCPDAVLIYADEDEVKGQQRQNPFFKTDWNPDLFLSQNYFGPLLLVRRSTLLEGWGSATDFRDLLLQITEKCPGHQIRHIPHVLYHCDQTKRPDIEAERPAVAQALKRRGDQGELTLCLGQGWRINYQPVKQPRVEIIIPTHNQQILLKKCIDSILEKTTYAPYHITIIDNRSNEQDALAYLKELETRDNISVLRDDSPFNYSALNNRAVKQSDAEFLLFLNNDTEVIFPDWLSEMVALGMRPHTGAVGAKLLYPNRTLQHAGVIVGMGIAAGHAFLKLGENDGGYFGRLNFHSNFSAVTAACLGLRRELFDEIGGFNEKQLAVAFNDVDFCLRLQQKGYWNVYSPNAVLFHHESVSRQDDRSGAGRNRLIKEVRYMTDNWTDVMINDPAYSPNLNLDPAAPSFTPSMLTRTIKPYRLL